MQTTIQIPPVSNKALWAGRIMSGLVILFLLVDGGIKLVPIEAVITTSRELAIPEHLARTLGVLTLIGTALYAWPRTSVLGAIFLTGYLGGAIYVHVRAGSPMLSHTLFGVYLGLLIWGGLYLRDGMVRALIPLRQSAD
jgi:hypothetical protein